MKKIITIKQLVDEINDMSKNNEYDFKAKETPSETTIKLGRIKLMTFSSNGSWKIESGMGRLEEEVQHTIIEYANNSNSDFWFKEPEKRYNVVIGNNPEGGVIAYYKKTDYSGYSGSDFKKVNSVNNDVSGYKLENDKDYQFTEKEIEGLIEEVCYSDDEEKIIRLGMNEVDVI